jgi:hypothetical protein
LSDSIDYRRHIRQAYSTPNIQSEGVYFPLDIVDISNLEFGTTIVAEGAAVVRAATGQWKVIALPFAWRANNLRPIEWSRHDHILQWWSLVLNMP